MSVWFSTQRNFVACLGGGTRGIHNLKLEDGEDGMVRFAGQPGVAIATDMAVDEWSFREGAFKLKLKMTKAMLGQWRAAGFLHPDGSLPMMRNHGSGFSPEPTDLVGTWENLRIEPRERSAGSHKALVGDPAFQPAMMNAWFNQAGAEPDAWRAVFEQRVISKVSVGFRVERAKMKQIGEEDGITVFEAPFEAREGSWVWAGQDPQAGVDRSLQTTGSWTWQHVDTDTGAGVGRQADHMTPEEIKAIVDQTLEAERARVEAAKPVMTVLPEPTIVPLLESTDVQRDSEREPKLWTSVQALAVAELGQDATDAITRALKADAPLATLQEEIRLHLVERQSNPKPPLTEKPPVDTHIEGGQHRSHVGLHDSVRILVARGMQNMKSRKVKDQYVEKGRKITEDWENADIKWMILDFARAQGILPSDYIPLSDGQFLLDLKTHWKAPDQALRGNDGSSWFAGEGCVKDRNGMIRILETMRRGGAGLVPADLPSLLQKITFLIFIEAHDSERLPFEQWSRSVVFDSTTTRKLVLWDAAIPFEKVVGGQPLPQGHLFDEEVPLEVAQRGMVFRLVFESLFADNSAQLTRFPALMGNRWGGAKSAHWVNTVIDGLFDGTTIYTGNQTDDQSEANIGAFFDNVLITSSDKRPVLLPSDLPANLAGDVHSNVMEPDFLLYGTRMNRAITNHFFRETFTGAVAPGARVNTDADQALTEFELGLTRVRTNVIKDKKLFLLVSGGSYPLTSHTTLSGSEMRMEQFTDTDKGKLPDFVARIVDSLLVQVTGPRSGYENVTT